MTGIFKSRSTTLLDEGSNHSQIIYKNASTAGFDNARNWAEAEIFTRFGAREYVFLSNLSLRGKGTAIPC
jgi:hypothetical protein